MAKDFTVTISESSPRVADFIKCFGRRELHIKSFIPQLMELPDFDEPQPCYLLDLEFVSEEELNRLAIHLSEKFNANLETVIGVLRNSEMPILATDCVVSVENPQKWIDFDDAPFSPDEDYEDYEEDWWGEE